MYVMRLFSFRLKQPYNLSEILLDTLAMQNCKHKIEKNANKFKYWITQNVLFFYLSFCPYVLNKDKMLIKGKKLT